MKPFVLSLLASSLLLAGCRKAEPTTPFQLGRVKTITQGDPGQAYDACPSIVITAPTKGSIFRPGEPIPIKVEITVPPDGAMPRNVMVELTDERDRQFDSFAPEPKINRGSGVYIFEGRIAAPEKKKGKFFLQTLAIDVVRRLPSATAENGPDTQSEMVSRSTRSAKVGVDVR